MRKPCTLLNYSRRRGYTDDSIKLMNRPTDTACSLKVFFMNPLTGHPSRLKGVIKTKYIEGFMTGVTHIMSFSSLASFTKTAPPSVDIVQHITDHEDPDDWAMSGGLYRNKRSLNGVSLRELKFKNIGRRSMSIRTEGRVFTGGQI